MGSFLAEQASKDVGATLALASLAWLLALGWLDLQDMGHESSVGNDPACETVPIYCLGQKRERMRFECSCCKHFMSRPYKLGLLGH